MRSTRYLAGALVGAASIAAASLLAIPASASTAVACAQAQIDLANAHAAEQGPAATLAVAKSADNAAHAKLAAATTADATEDTTPDTTVDAADLALITAQSNVSAADSTLSSAQAAEAVTARALARATKEVNTCGATVTPTPTPPPVGLPAGFANCAQAFAAGVSNIPSTDSRYRRALDRDNDGIACETNGDDTRVGLPAPTPTSAPTVIYKYVGGKYCKCTNGGPCVPVPTPAPIPAPSTVVIAPPTQTLVAPPPVTVPSSPVIIYPPVPSTGTFSQIPSISVPSGSVSTGDGSVQVDSDILTVTVLALVHLIRS